MSLVSFSTVDKVYSRRDRRFTTSTLIPGPIGRRVRERDAIYALRDVSFSLAQGGSLGLVGPNGAGKSTLLKLVAGITRPTSGTVQSRGRMAVLLELGVGFHPDLSGRENLRFYATLLGLSRRELASVQDEIFEFSGLGSFLDVPVRKYSSGMLARLGFSIGSHVPVDLLIIDEALSVGDPEFQARCHQRLSTLRETGIAVMFVTHQLWSVPLVCQDALVLRAGRIEDRGSAHEVVARYQSGGNQLVAEGNRAMALSGPALVESQKGFHLTAQLVLDGGYPDGEVLALLRNAGERVVASSSASLSDLGASEPGRYQISSVIERPSGLMPGRYTLLFCVKPDRDQVPVGDFVILPIEVPGLPNNQALRGDLELGGRWSATAAPTSH